MTYKASVYLGEVDTTTQAQKDAFQKIANIQGKQTMCTFNRFYEMKIGDNKMVIAEFVVESKPNAQNCERFFSGVAVAVRTLVQK